MKRILSYGAAEKPKDITLRRVLPSTAGIAGSHLTHAHVRNWFCVFLYKHRRCEKPISPPRSRTVPHFRKQGSETQKTEGATLAWTVQQKGHLCNYNARTELTVFFRL